MQETEKFLMLAGLALLLVGAALYWFKGIPWLEKLPGDILLRKPNFTFYFPIVTCLLLSVLLTILFHFFNRK